MELLQPKRLPLGFRFHPSDEELVNHYLKGKINGRINSEAVVIPEVDVCKWEPWDLPAKSVLKSDDLEWYFLSPKARKYPTGRRAKRATEAGYWKSTGRDRIIKTKPPGLRIIGMKKTLVFHHGRAPDGVRTNWLMHEYRTSESEFDSGEQDSFVLCRLFKKPEEEGASSNVDGVERSVGSMESGGFSPIPIRSLPSETRHGTGTPEEFPPLVNQELPDPDMQEHLQILLNNPDTQSTGIESWSTKRGDCATAFASRPEESHFNGNGALVFSNHAPDVGAEVSSHFLDPDYEQLGLDDFPHISSQMPLSKEYSICDMVDQRLNELFLSCLPKASAGEVLDKVRSNPDEDSLEVTDTQKDSVPRVVSDEHIFVIEEDSPWNSASRKESGMGRDVDTIAAIVRDDLEFDASAGFSESAFLPSGSSDGDNDNAYRVTGLDDVNLLWEKAKTGLQNDPSMGSAADSWHQESTSTTERSNQIVQTRQNLMMSGQGSARRRLCLQKIIHTGSMSNTDSELSSKKDDNEVKSVITEAGECAEHRIAEDTEVSGSIFLDDVNSTSDQVDADDAIFSEISHESKSRPRHRKSTRENSDNLEGPSLHSETPGTGSVSITKMIVVLLAVLLIFVVISWYLSS